MWFGGHRAARFFYPLEHIPRVAVVGRAVQRQRQVRTFAAHQRKEVLQYAPQALAAPVQLLRDWACHDETLTLSHSIIAYSTFADPVTKEDRDLFWRVFQVPVFEQRISESGALIAWECQAHNGLHLVRGVSPHLCACGLPAEIIPLASEARITCETANLGC
jgi:hypothetical protein